MKQFWILHTPGGNSLQYDEPMNMDWTCCKKTKLIDYESYLTLKEQAFKLKEKVVEYAESGLIEAFHCESDSLSDELDNFDSFLKTLESEDKKPFTKQESAE